MTLNITVRFQAGLWSNVDSPLFKKNTRRMRSGKCSLVGRSECTDQATNKTLKRDFGDEDWGFFHPKRERRPIDCSLEWDKEFWDLKERGVKQLTDFRVTTKGGVHLLPSMAPWVILESQLNKNILLLFSSAHNNLDNTTARANAWIDESHTFVGWQRQMANRLSSKYPRKRILRIHTADVNKNWFDSQERMMVRNHQLANTGLTWGYGQRTPDKGDHGKQLISYTYSNGVMVNTKVMAGDGFSDHNPIETLVKA